MGQDEPVKNKLRFFTATRLIVLGFLVIIFIGAGLLALPFSAKSGGVSFLTALFTATSATCVTGLSVVVVYDTYSVFGQIVILLLIQIGGLGFMSLTSFLYLAFSRRITLTSRLMMKEDMENRNIDYVKKIIYRIFILTFVTEAIGAAALAGAFSRYMPAGEAVWNGLFHSISAFCNAGLDIINLPSGVSYMPFASDPAVLVITSFLIIIGGLGFLVASDLWEARRWRNLRLHTKVVLIVTLCLILFGTFFILGAEFDNPKTMGTMSGGDKLLNAFFQSVTARTAGFNSLDIASMNPASQVCLEFLMFIGASPGSTGGGIKTTTLFLLILTVTSVIRRRRYTIVDKQTISASTIHKAASVLVLALSIMVGSVMALALTDGGTFRVSELLFEQISAYATVGLSLGITSGLSVAGQLIIILNMFLGRVGALTFFIAFTAGKEAGVSKIIYPECSIDI